MPRGQAAKRLFSTLARQAEFSASGLIAPGQALLAARTTTQVLGGAGASAVKVSGVRGGGALAKGLPRACTRFSDLLQGRLGTQGRPAVL